MSGKPTYKVVTVPKPPFVIYDQERNNYSGMLIDLLNELARRLGFQYDIYVEKDMEYGYMDDEGNWNGMIRELMEGNADIGLGAVSLMSERMRVVDFTEPIYPPTGISILLQKPIVHTAFYRFLTVLELDVWMCILSAYIFTSALIWIFDTWSPYSYQNRKEKFKDDPEKRIFTLKESLWFCLTSLTPQGGGDAPKNLSGRLVAATWWLFGFIIIASYTANLAAFLTIAKFEKTIDTFEDLIAQYRVSYTVIENSSTYRYFERMSHIEHKCYELWKDITLNDSLTDYERAQLAVWEYPLSDKYIKIFSALTHHNMVHTLSEGLERFNEPVSNFALITEATDVQYQVMTDCQFKEIGPEFSKKPYAIILQKNSNLTKLFNEAIFTLGEETWIKSITDKWWMHNPNKQTCYDIDDSKGIPIENIGGVFVLVGTGVVSAIVILIYEFFYYTFCREKYERFYDKNIEKLKSIILKKSQVTNIPETP